MVSQENPSDKESKRQLFIKQMKPIIINKMANVLPQNSTAKNNLEFIYNVLKRQKPFSPDKETLKLGFSFLDESRIDVKCCKQLYSIKMYHRAIFHLQQAVEKSMKAYVLLEGYYKASECKKLRTHDTPLILIKAVLSKTGIKELAKKLNDQTLYKTINTALIAIKDENQRIKIASSSKEEINQFLSQIEDYQKMTQQMQVGLSQGFTNVGKKPMPTTFFNAVFAMIIIMILAMITFPHESYTRYPDDKMTPINYTLQLGIVNEAPKILSLLERQIDNLENNYQRI